MSRCRGSSERVYNASRLRGEFSPPPPAISTYRDTRSTTTAHARFVTFEGLREAYPRTFISKINIKIKGREIEGIRMSKLDLLSDVDNDGVNNSSEGEVNSI